MLRVKWNGFTPRQRPVQAFKSSFWGLEMIQIPDEFSLSMLNEGAGSFAKVTLGYVNIALKKGPGNLLLFPENNILESWRFFITDSPKVSKAGIARTGSCAHKGRWCLVQSIIGSFSWNATWSNKKFGFGIPEWQIMEDSGGDLCDALLKCIPFVPETLGLEDEVSCEKVSWCYVSLVVWM